MVEVGQVISGKYKLLRLLGDGGMGSVYEAEHLGLGTRVAIKVLHADLARRSNVAERFLQEARVSAQIRSPHVVQVTDVDRTPDGVAYLVMELLQGEPLSAVMKRERQMPLATASEYTIQILSALEAAHALGVIHRDLKPDNVFVTFVGGKSVLKLIDFGIAKLKTAQAGQETKNLTVAGMLMGTPEYMAPEQAYSADKVDVRADLYAVGVMMYEMLAGASPATADDPRVLILKVERGEVTPLVQVVPSIQPGIAGFVHRAMAARPELRFANASEMRIALEETIAGKRQVTAKLTNAPQQQQPAQGQPMQMSVVPGPGGTSAAAPFADTADARPGGTLMGAPVDAALVNTGPPPPMMHQHPGMHHPPPAMSMPMHSPTETPPRRGGGNGLIIALAIVALLLGAGAVTAWYVTNQPTTASTAPPVFPTNPPTATTTTPGATTTTPVTPVTPLTTSTVLPPGPAPGPQPQPQPKKDAGTAPSPFPPFVDAGAPAPAPADAGGGQQTVIVTPFGTFQFPGPRPPFYPADQPWPPPNITPLPAPPK